MQKENNLQYIETEFKVLKLPHYIENDSNLKYGSELAHCFDVCACIAEPITLKPHHRAKVSLGIKFVPEHTIWYKILSRSGLAVNYGIITIGGVIDCDYRGEVFAIMLNTDPEASYTINPGDKIAQIEIPYPYKAKFTEISEEEFNKLSTSRGAGGFGSTGK
ncbi:MAG: dUTP diphosphatase [Lactobacillus sp.]|jgi:dUTP pyrophosphatase|nr:dUTP diphosphatase [Lactobacillus sp.]